MKKVILLQTLILGILIPLQASTFTINNLNDSGAGSLRQAIISANADGTATSGSPHLIDATAVSGTIELQSALPSLAKHMVINGPSDNSLTIERSSGTPFRIFYINSGQTVEINNLNIANGYATGDAPSYMQHGSGIQNHGNLSLNHCIISGCKIPTGGYGFGGSLYNGSTSSSDINNCIFMNNFSSLGGAIAYEGGTHSITNSTISGNKANQQGGGIYAKSGTIMVQNCTFSADSSMNFSRGSAVYVDGATVTIFNSTLAYNHASYTGTISTSGSGALQVSNSILAGNTFGNSSSDVDGATSSLYGHNIFGTTVTLSGNSNNTMNVSASDVISSNLTNNGGFTPTYSLVSCGYAINNGTTLGSPATDQRGISRVDSVDIGALEDNTGAMGRPIISQNISSKSVCSGTATDFTVKATQSNTYQWQVNNGSGSFNPIADNGTYSGSSTSTLSIASTSGMNGYQFRCKITNTNCSSITLYSNTATLNTISNPTISTQPAYETYGCAGGNAIISVSASGGSSLTYQWQVDQGSGFSDLSNSAPYSGVGTSTLTISANTGLEGYVYRVMISNECGGAPISSDPSTLKVSTTLSISNHPLNQTICAGGTTTFSVTASGENNFYRWQYNNGSGVFIDLFDDLTYYENTYTSQLTFKQAHTAFSGYNFRCKITNACNYTGVFSNAAVVTIAASDYTIDVHPNNQTYCSGGDASFSVATSGGSVSYQWQVNTGSGFTNLADDATYANTGTNTLLISGITSGMNGFQYRCAMNSATCSNIQYSNPATLTMDNGISISSHPSSVTTCENSNTGFSITASGNSLNYQWQVNAGSGFSDISDNSAFSGSSTASLTITPPSFMSGYLFRCIVSNLCNSDVNSSDASLTVIPGLQITSHPSGETAWENGEVEFSTTATGDNILYAWQVNSGSGFSNILDNSTYSGTSTSNLSLSGLTSDMNGYTYRCLVSSSCGAQSSSAATLSVIEPSICMVTVDDVTGKNMVVFEKTSGLALVDSFRIYKEGSVTNQFIQIGRLGQNEYSAFVDNSSSPSQHADIYKIAVKDTDGNITPLSLPHKTMHLTINQGINNTWNLIWNAYSGVSVSSYNIYRGTSPSNMTLLQSLSGSNTSFTDLSPPQVSNLYYQIEIVGTACNPTAKVSSLSSIRSNIAETQNAVTGINNKTLDSQVKIYPNPSKGKFIISGVDPSCQVSLYDITGQKLKINFEVETDNTLDLPSGIYILEISLEGATTRKKLVIE